MKYDVNDILLWNLPRREEIEKPNKIKIDIKFDKVRDNITERLDAYENKLEIIKQKIVAAKRANNNIEAKHQSDIPERAMA